LTTGLTAAATAARPPLSAYTLRGLDFSSSPTKRKPGVLATGRLISGTKVRLDSLRTLPTLADYAACLAEPGPWVCGFDFPFGLPRELVLALGWPTHWPALIAHYAALHRATIRDTFAAFCAARAPGGKFAHRACDRPAGSSPSMKWVNPPVAYMLHAGMPPLLAAGCDLPGLHAGDVTRVALEAYPGLVARDLLGARSYKSDDAAKQTPARAAARETLVTALQGGQGRLGLRLVLSPALRALLIDDASGDQLDAALCLLQAAWALSRPGWGLPALIDPLEGWIVGA
jgi:hypothetical protein